jgi:hypothetical protein
LGKAKSGKVRKEESGKRKAEIGKRKEERGNWELGIGNWKLERKEGREITITSMIKS